MSYNPLHIATRGYYCPIAKIKKNGMISEEIYLFLCASKNHRNDSQIVARAVKMLTRDINK